MLTRIFILTAMMFSLMYPLCFWISLKDPLKNNFHRFHIGLPSIIGGITCVFILLWDFPREIKINALIWQIFSLSFSGYSWKKEYPNALLMTAPSIVGLFVFYQLQSYLLNNSLIFLIVSILAGGIFCSCLFAMNLGHWYLNVHGLPLSHLIRASYVFWFLLAWRGIWDIFALATAKVLYRGNLISLYNFTFQYDGFLLWVAFLFGLIFPFLSMFFVKGTLAVKNTQSTTGILYVILGSILIGDMTYKYYSIKYGIYL